MHRCAVGRPQRRVGSVFKAAALRPNSREIVDGDRPSWPAISRTPSSRATASAICSHSAKQRYRPVGAAAQGGRLEGGIPPHCRNQRVPTAGATPAIAAASSLVCSCEIAFQNGHRSERCSTGGLPDDRTLSLSYRSDFNFFCFIDTSVLDVLRRRLDFTAEVGHPAAQPAGKARADGLFRAASRPDTWQQCGPCSVQKRPLALKCACCRH